MGEFDTLRGQFIEIGSLDKRMPIGSGVPPAHVVSDEDYEVGMIRRSGAKEYRR